MNSDTLGTCNNLIYFNSFGVEHISKEIKKFIGNKNITNIFRVQTYDSVMGGFVLDFCIGFIDCMLKGNILSEHKNLFLPTKYKKNDKIIPKISSIDSKLME